MLLNEIVNVKSGVIVYHGSTQEFTKFNMNKIGESKLDKGGWGIYVSESPEVARQYTPEGNSVIMKFMLPSGRYFDLDSIMDEHTFLNLMEELEYYDEKVFEKTESFREEIANYDFYDYALSGFQFYDILSHDFGSKRKMSLFLKESGFNGNTFMDKTNPNIRNYVLFSSEGLRRINE